MILPKKDKWTWSPWHPGCSFEDDGPSSLQVFLRRTKLQTIRASFAGQFESAALRSSPDTHRGWLVGSPESADGDSIEDPWSHCAEWLFRANRWGSVASSEGKTLRLYHLILSTGWWNCSSSRNTADQIGNYDTIKHSLAKLSSGSFLLFHFSVPLQQYGTRSKLRSGRGDILERIREIQHHLPHNYLDYLPRSENCKHHSWRPAITKVEFLGQSEFALWKLGHSLTDSETYMRTFGFSFTLWKCLSAHANTDLQQRIWPNAQ